MATDFATWLKAQLKSLDQIANPQEHVFDDLAYIIQEAQSRAAQAGPPAAVRACRNVRPGPVGVDLAREILAECLAACGRQDEPADADTPMTVKQASERYGIGERTIYDLCATNTLKHVRIGNKRGGIRIHPDDMEPYLAATSNGHQPLKYL